MRQVIANDFRTEAHARLHEYPAATTDCRRHILFLGKTLNQGVVVVPCPRKMVKAKARVGPTDSPEAV